MKFTEKVAFKLKDTLLTWGIKISLVFDSPGSTAWLLSIIPKKNASKSGYRILGIGRSIFNDDLYAMRQFSGRIEYVIIPYKYFQIIITHFFDPIEWKSVTESNYHTPEFCTKGKAGYYGYLKRMMPDFIKRLEFDAIISGNIGYLVQQELSRAAVELGVPFVALHKEAVVVLPAYRNFLEVYKNHHFVGTKVLFYNRQCMQGFLDLGLPGLTQEKAEYVGIPRLDHYFNNEKQDVVDENLIVFFSFIPKYSCRFLTKNQEKLDQADAKGKEFFKVVMEYANRHPEKKIVIKTKNASQYPEYPERILKSNFPQGISNITIVNSGDPSAMIRKAGAVIGFNSTTLIEALIAGKKVLSPNFAEIMQEEAWSFFGDHPQLVNYIETLDDMEKAMSSTGISYDQAIKDDFLEKYISTCNGGASKRTEDELIKIIQESQGQRAG